MTRFLPAALVLALACSDLTGPLRSGTLSLVAIDGAAPPMLRWATANCDYTVTGATLTVGTADSAELVVNEVYDCSRAGGPVTTGGRAYPGTYTVVGERFTLTSPTVGGSPIRLTGTVFGNGSVIDVDDDADYAAGPGVLRLRR